MSGRQVGAGVLAEGDLSRLAAPLLDEIAAIVSAGSIVPASVDGVADALDMNIFDRTEPAIRLARDPMRVGKGLPRLRSRQPGEVTRSGGVIGGSGAEPRAVAGRERADKILLGLAGDRCEVSAVGLGLRVCIVPAQVGRNQTIIVAVVGIQHPAGA